MKIDRHLKIIELIKNFDICTQEELVFKLKQSGFNVTQATISRDIKKLKLKKVTINDKSQKYVLGSNNNKKDKNFNLTNVFKESITSISYAGNIIVVKTLNGMAMAIAMVIDNMNDSKILGTIAGDDTIFCAIENVNESFEIGQNIINNLNKLGEN